MSAKIETGQKVFIKRGPFAGIPAVVNSWKPAKVIAIVELFGKLPRSRSMLIPVEAA
ncbi:MAG: hypothetical protein IPK59_23450 [Rhodospirillaceae bacterium]|nr:hypothetical protein [Rhodospirillaceae bacterium]